MSRKVVAGIKETRYATLDDVERTLAALGEVSRADVQRGLDALLEPPALSGDAYKLACSFFVGVVKACPDRALFGALARALARAPHAHAREALVRALPLVNNLAEHAVLVQHLRSSDDHVRSAALRVIEKVAVASTYEVLAADVRSGGPFAAPVPVLTELAQRLGNRAVPVFAAAVSSPDARMVAAGFEAAARSRDAAIDARVFLSLARARMGDPDDDVAGAAVTCFSAVVELEDEFVDEIASIVELGGPRAIAAALRGVVRFVSPRTLAILEQRIMRGPSRISIVGLQVLQEIATDDVLPVLVGAISHRRQRVRTEAVRVLKVLAAQGNIDMARAILFLLRSRDANVRRMASEVLQAMNQRGASIWPRLVSFIRDEDWWVRERLADALVPMAGADLVPYLVPVLDDAAASMRRYAVNTLGRIGDGKALGALLVRARDDADWLVREEAVRAIGRIGDERAVPYIVKLVDTPGLEMACLDALRNIKRDDARGKLGELLTRPERDVRMSALRYAQVIEASEHIDTIAGLLHDADADIARAAAATLRAWHYGGASDPALDEAGRVLAELLRQVVKNDGSDLILTSGRPAFMKLQGRTERLTQRDLTAENVYELLSPLLSREHVDAIGDRQDVDFSYENRRVGARFRVNAFQGDGGLGAVFRVIRGEIVPLDSLGVPAVVDTFCDLESGLVLFGGPPGSGKSTTMAGIIHKINQTQSRHVICIEDPIEGLHSSMQSLITQRELGVHTLNYLTALRAALREDPDVILVGELRDLETIQFAVTAAETGHLVFGTVHAVAADSCVERVVNVFPPDRQAQIRTMLSDTLKAIVCQHLLMRRGGGRVLACEVMLNTEAVANLIRKGQGHQIASAMTLQREAGMQLMDDSLQALANQGIIDEAEAYVKARDKARFPVTGQHAQLTPDLIGRMTAQRAPPPARGSDPPHTPSRPRAAAPAAAGASKVATPPAASPSSAARAATPPIAKPAAHARPGAQLASPTPSRGAGDSASPMSAAPHPPQHAAKPTPAVARPAPAAPAVRPAVAPIPAAVQSRPIARKPAQGPAPVPIVIDAPSSSIPVIVGVDEASDLPRRASAEIDDGAGGDIDAATIPLPTIPDHQDEEHDDADAQADEGFEEKASNSGVRPAMKNKPTRRR